MIRHISRRGGWALLAGLIAGCAPVAPAPSHATSPAPSASGPLPPPAILAQMTAPGTPADQRPAPQPHRPGLAALYDDLHRLERGEIRHLHIVQIGDSHTAGDFFSGRLRDLFQARFGNGGRGMMPPGHPFNGIRQREIAVTQTGRWSVANSLNADMRSPYGIAGFVVTSGTPGAALTLSPVEPTTIDRVEIDYLLRPHGGSFRVVIDGAIAESVSTSGPPDSPGRTSIDIPPGAHDVQVIADAKDIAFTGWSADHKEPGVLLDSFGVVGATAGVVSRWSEAVMQADLTDLRPSLIIVAYGTNEGVQTALNLADYETGFASLLSQLIRLAPQSSILVVGPPDVQRARGKCVKLAPTCHWYTPATVAQVRAAQKRVAERLGASFWDWSSVMPQGIHRLVIADPPLARSDHVHFTAKGYEMAADALFAALMQSYRSN